MAREEKVRMRGDGRDKIGTWPTPELPVVVPFGERDRKLMRDITEVFERHGIKGKLIRVEFGCGMPPPKPKVKIRCYRECVPGPDDAPICTWVCW
jgi:hypothetical protein